MEVGEAENLWLTITTKTFVMAFPCVTATDKWDSRSNKVCNDNTLYVDWRKRIWALVPFPSGRSGRHPRF